MRIALLFGVLLLAACRSGPAPVAQPVDPTHVYCQSQAKAAAMQAWNQSTAGFGAIQGATIRATRDAAYAKCMKENS